MRGNRERKIIIERRYKREEEEEEEEVEARPRHKGNRAVKGIRVLNGKKEDTHTHTHIKKKMTKKMQ